MMMMQKVGYVTLMTETEKSQSVLGSVFISPLTKFLTELKNYSAYIKVSTGMYTCKYYTITALWAGHEERGINDVVLGKGS